MGWRRAPPWVRWANPRRIAAMEAFISDARQHGATVHTGGNRIGNKGNFFEPTVMIDVPKHAHVMNDEPFGPLAVISPFSAFEDAVTEANRLPYGLASYAYTRSAKTANATAARGGSRHDVDQSPRARPAGSAIRRSEGFWLWLGRRTGSDRGLSQHKVRHAGRAVGPMSANRVMWTYR